MAEARVRAVGIDTGPGRPVVLLEEAGGRGRLVPVGIGEAEAAALAAALAGMPPASRPDTYRLILAVLAEFGEKVRQVRVRALQDRVFHAELVLEGGTVVDARTSDAVVLALLEKAPIDVAEAVFDEVGVAAESVTVQGADDRAAGRADDPASEVEEFRRFLDTARPEDFGPEERG
ncbi:bifunctional nuclease family protein [Pseudonocardia nematodicida]|uniref:Bifunctional nuclease family protein n=1 Tax=Pseudonocardia nematodicida TaxID=1206997 RepID=A0ABV1K6M4_9PSEU